MVGSGLAELTRGNQINLLGWGETTELECGAALAEDGEEGKTTAEGVGVRSRLSCTVNRALDLLLVDSTTRSATPLCLPLALSCWRSRPTS